MCCWNSKNQSAIHGNHVKIEEKKSPPRRALKAWDDIGPKQQGRRLQELKEYIASNFPDATLVSLHLPN